MIDLVEPPSCTPRSDGDRCPGVLRLHAAVDGGVARVRLPGGRADAGQLDALARGARLGSGIVEVTSRANVQIRGLMAESAAELAELIGEAGLLPSNAHERARNILASPFAGRHPESAGGSRAAADIDELISALDRGLCADPALAALSGRFSFLIDDGSGVLSGRDHDIALRVRDGSAGAQAALAIDGRESGLVAPIARAAELALNAARAFLSARGASGAWGIRDVPDGADRVAALLGVRLAQASEPGPRLPVRPGRLRQRDGRVAITALPPLARLDPDELEALAALARRCGAGARFSPWRTVTLVDIGPADADPAERELAGLGLVLDPRSGWSGLSACAGLGACARARTDVRAAAANRSALRGPGAPAEHWTACERRCGERAEVPIAVSVGRDAVEVRDGRSLHRVAGTGDALTLLAGETSEVGA